MTNGISSGGPTLFSLIQDQVKRQPNRIAILAPSQSPLTYAALYTQISYCARVLSNAGFNHRSRIGIVLANGPEAATCCLGISCFATSAPLNPNYQRDEFIFYLNDIQASALVLPQGYEGPAREAAVELKTPVLELVPIHGGASGSFRLADSTESNIDLVDFASSDDIALILHTSGTTSRPKIVPLSHANLCASVRNIESTLSLTSSDCCLNVLPLFHIHGLVAALFSTLGSGGSIVCTPGFSQDHFWDWVNEFSPTWYTAVPTIHQAVQQLRNGYATKAPGHQFRFVRSSSAALPPSTLAALESLFQAPVIEAYGMTEAAHQMASNPLPPAERKPGTVGLPAGPEIAIVDESGKSLAQGQTGEIVIRGDNVTDGYENNPAANESAFISGWLRTGDQGHIDASGYLTITGRLKEIINRGGEKISPREIDEALIEHTAVAQATAFMVPHSTLGEDIVAAVVIEPGMTVTSEELRAYLFEKLTDYKVPSSILLLDAIPKGATGKIQRLTLAEKLKSYLAIEYVAPSSEIEKKLANIIQKTLGCEQVGLDHNFFALGGDSLRATQVISQINKVYQLELPAPSLFHHPTIRELVVLVNDSCTDREAHIAQLVNEIENLTDEEVERLLDQNGE